MPKQTPKTSSKNRNENPNIFGLHRETLNQPITQTLETNYMPYAMSVIVSRAIPEIDGFKPSHRKLLYTMYRMGLLTGGRTKSANIVGQTMRLNPHGDSAIYETMVRLSRGYEALLAPFVDSKGNFGKAYSRDTAYAASRYTEAKLAQICTEIFRDIDKNTVDFVDNYDSSTKEPTLLPTTFPNILVSANIGIAVGMASNICGFNLSEVCRAAIEYMKNERCDLLSVMPAPDFPTGGELLYNREEMERVYEDGRGGIRVRAKWSYVPKENIIEITEIPYTTTSEAIIDKIAELIKSGKIREISDARDETALSGLKIALDLKRGTDPDALMQKLFKLTPLQDSFGCNFNILINGIPQVLGVRGILREWTAWRMECVRRRVRSDLEKKNQKLHLLYGLRKILLDIDRAISIIRETEAESEVLPNLMIGFGIDEAQADYIAEIRLRNINREYIINRTNEISELEAAIANLKDILEKPQRVKSIISDELRAVDKKYGQPRKTAIISDFSEAEVLIEDSTPDYPVTVFVSQEGYIKKITKKSLQMASDQKFKDGDELAREFESANKNDLLVFTDKQNCYKYKLADLPDTKASSLGEFLPSVLEFEPDERVVFVCDTEDYTGSLMIFFENGKGARVSVSSYETKQNRRKLTKAYSDLSPAVAFLELKAEREVALFSTDGRCVVITTAYLEPKPTRTTQGIQTMRLRKNARLKTAAFAEDTALGDIKRYLAKAIPASGAELALEDRGYSQQTL
ncbi:MAG: topoisomerase IV [Oscillospiraceae bacterium]|jgi:DNA gyrase subunit A|nr:topoisomerase IV [Oscillospiraceae bacterium]